MPALRTVAFAAIFLAAPLGSANAQDTDPVVAQTRAAADAAHEQLVDRYRALWAGLNPAQKAAFSTKERAWLNSGRAEQESRCIAVSRANSPALAAQSCRLAVTELRLAALPAPLLQASAER